MATLSSSPLTVASTTSNVATPRMAAPRKVRYLAGMNSFAGLKAQNGAVAALGLPATADQSFAKIISSLREHGRSGAGAGGATCNAAAEIFRIAAIMNGLVLVGVAVGFVLLRIEAFVEESEV